MITRIFIFCLALLMLYTQIENTYANATKEQYQATETSSQATETLIQELYKSEHEVDRKIIKQALEEGGDVNAIDGNTPIFFYAIMLTWLKPELQLYQLFLEHGVNVNIRYNDGKQEETPLMYAVVFPYRPLVATLIEYGADINYRTTSGNTALIQAADYESDIEVVDLLIDNGADIHISNNQGMTALDIAMKGGLVSMTRKLIALGANINILGFTPLMQASVLGDIDNARLILAQQDNTQDAITAFVNKTDTNGWTALMWAAYYNSTDIVELLLKYGADKDLTNNDDLDAIRIAYEAQNMDIVQILAAH